MKTLTKVVIGFLFLIVLIGCSDCITEKVTVQVRVASHSSNSVSREITVFVLEDGTTHEQRHHIGNIGNIGDIYPVQVRVKYCE